MSACARVLGFHFLDVDVSSVTCFTRTTILQSPIAYNDFINISFQFISRNISRKCEWLNVTHPNWLWYLVNLGEDGKKIIYLLNCTRKFVAFNFFFANRAKFADHSCSSRSSSNNIKNVHFWIKSTTCPLTCVCVCVCLFSLSLSLS